MERLTAICVVAHPDDCVIFAWPFISSHPEFTWKIVYLTYNNTEPRAQEMSAYWQQRGIATEFLGFYDNFKDQLEHQLHFWNGLDAEAAVCTAAKDADLILTHNADGEYDHIHHRLVHNATQHLNIPKVYFDFNCSNSYNKQYNATETANLDELPLHQNVIAGFANRDQGHYVLTPEAEILIKKNNENINT